MIRTSTEPRRYTSYLPWILYVSSLQYFLVQLVVALRFSPTYSLANNTISDLGNTYCGAYGTRIVCSPWHTLMNVSFVIVGLTIFFGSLLAYRAIQKSRATLIGLSMFAAGGVGTMLVGLFPENTIATLHVLGAALPLVVGNVGLIVLGYSLPVPKLLRLYSVLTGVIALFALALLLLGIYLGIGLGGMERIAAYPQTLWMIVVGIYYLSEVMRSHQVDP